MKKTIMLLMYICISLMCKSQDSILKMDVSDYELPSFFYLPPTSKTVMECLIYYDVKKPKIVLAQAILETGYFKSNACVKYNNLFGMMKGNGKFYKLDHWTESVKLYKDLIQTRYNSDNTYYYFLKRIGYAKDKNYVYKLKNIIELYENTK